MLMIALSMPILDDLNALHNGLRVTSKFTGLFVVLMIVAAMRVLYNLVRMVIYDRRALLPNLSLLLLYAAVAAAIIFQPRP